ncbi:hypothetical protein SCP_0607190 [Sparassis crispa]|uniref:Uncharacterized protein n=1 Tax=Sparassis crispa TaxID=139825 RepID=A0A401GRE4_9APHY|nr:hypothetical protein SCP_0607190 [Sparassis crispa]GBE84739.1 hypothetical protein SCP_0607190 [Sparassis crispa]
MLYPMERSTLMAVTTAVSTGERSAHTVQASPPSLANLAFRTVSGLRRGFHLDNGMKIVITVGYPVPHEVILGLSRMVRPSDGHGGSAHLCLLSCRIQLNRHTYVPRTSPSSKLNKEPEAGAFDGLLEGDGMFEPVGMGKGTST